MARKEVIVPKERRKGNGNWIKVIGARENNLKNINVEFPLGVLTAVTGVSGSGKSTLVNEILFKALHRAVNRARRYPGAHKEIRALSILIRLLILTRVL